MAEPTKYLQLLCERFGHRADKAGRCSRCGVSPCKSGTSAGTVGDVNNSRVTRSEVQ